MAGVTSFSYDRGNKLVSLTDPVGNTTQFAYDGLGRMTMETNALGQSRSYYYDSAETLAKRIDRRGKGIVWDYDDLNRPTAESWYDDASPVASVSVLIGGSASRWTPTGPDPVRRRRRGSCTTGTISRSSSTVRTRAT